MSAKVAGLRKTVDQLRREADIERIRVSEAGADLMAYCEAHASEDFLVTGESNLNPFKEKKPCNIL